jgi:hypothetical protein
MSEIVVQDINQIVIRLYSSEKEGNEVKVSSSEIAITMSYWMNFYRAKSNIVDNWYNELFEKNNMKYLLYEDK